MPRCTPARFQSAENTRRSFETRSLDLFRIFQQATDYHHHLPEAHSVGNLERERERESKRRIEKLDRQRERAETLTRHRGGKRRKRETREASSLEDP